MELHDPEESEVCMYCEVTLKANLPVLTSFLGS